MTTLFLIIQLSFLNPGIPTDIDSSEDEAKVETAVVNWANSSFLSHSNYKFEQFKAFYTDDYFIQTARIELYGDKITALKEKKANGEYTGSEETYFADINKLTRAVEKSKAIIKTIDRVTHYQIHFWTNIQTRDGITVYYELNMKLDNDYKVIESLENSSIGKKNDASKIAYKAGNSEVLVIEK
ncbi:MAG: hypothetical protein GQ574_17215 [Crocinitomix sp.]|nr:hypothetical protein [Crocinitomix sp.]